MKDKVIRLNPLYWIFIALVLVTCDPLTEDLTNKQVIINPSGTDYYILPNSSAVIDLKSIISSSFTNFTLKVLENPSRGKLVSLNDDFQKYEPNKDFMLGDDQFKVSCISEGRVLKTIILTIHMSQDVTGFPCGLYGVKDHVFTKPDSAIMVQFLANDRICGLTKSQIRSAILSQPKHGQVSLVGDSAILYLPHPGFTGIDELVYKATSDNNSKNPEESKETYGLIAIDVIEPCSLSHLEDYYLDLTDNIYDQRGTGACGNGYYAPFWTILHNYCASTWASKEISLVKSTGHSGLFCIGDDNELSYTPNQQVQSVNDTAQVKICVNGSCKKVFFYVKSEIKYTGSWSSQTLRNGLWTTFFIDENTGYVGGEGLLKTTDGGQTWNELPAPFNISEIYFLDSNNGFIACTDGLRITSNGGASWKYVFFQFQITSIYFISPNTGFVATASDAGDVSSIKLFKTTNGGSTWNIVLGEIDIDAVRHIRFQNSTTGYAHIFGSIIKTNDAGETWQRTYTNNGSIQGRTYACSSLAVTNSFIFSVFWKQSGNAFLGNVWRSGDGASWAESGPSWVHTVAFSPSGDLGIAFGSVSLESPLIPPIYLTHNKAITWTSEGRDGVYPTSASIPSNRVAYILCEGGSMLKYSTE